MTADGKIDTFERQGSTISSVDDWQRVDQLRAESDAVMVGGRTLIEEDPRLTVKSPELRKERLSRGLAENHLTLALDLGDPGAVESAANETLRKFGKVDIVLQLVGGWTGGQPVKDLDSSQISDMLQQHAWTTFFLAQAFVPRLLENEWGRIVAISSPFAAAPRAKGAPYAIGKAAQEALMLTLAQELRGSGVTANILLVKTIDLAHKRELEPSPKIVSWSTPEEIVGAIQYLISDEARTVNGARIPLYGSP